MLIHVIPRAQVSRTPVLTYRTSESVVVGQLVQVPLRGRSIPGIVVKINVSADTTAPIQSIRATGSTVVPSSFVDSLDAIANYYGVVPATILMQVGAMLTRPYLANLQPPRTETQECVVTPAHTTPLATALHTTHQSIAQEDAAARRRQWHQAASGHALRTIGGMAAITLPYASLRSIILDAPFASPYTSNRTPGLNTALVACLIARSTGAALTIRTPLPPSVVAALLPVPTATTYVQPKLHPISPVPLGTHGYITTELIDTVKEQLRNQKKVLVFINRLPTESSRGVSIDRIALDLEQRLGRPVGIAHKGTPPATVDVVVATIHALYDQQLTWEFAIILSIEGLVSANQPRSPFAAVELLAALASRSPVYAQYHDPAHPLVQAVLQQLSAVSLEQLPIFSHRLITAHFPKKTTAAHISYRTELDTLWPQPLIDPATGAVTYIAPHNLTIAQRELLQRRPTGVRLFTDADSLPPLTLSPAAKK